MAFPPIPMPRSARPGGYPAVDDFWSKLNAGIGRNSNALIGLGTGLLSAPSFDQGLAAGGQGFMQGAQADSAYRVAEEAKAARQQQINMTMEAVQQWPDLVKLLEAGNDTAPILSEAFKRMSPGYGQAGGDNLMSVGGHIYDKASGQWISPPQTADNRQNISLAGQWGRDATGKPVFLQPSSTGEMIPAQVPEGVELMGPFETSAQRSGGAAFGGQVGDAQFSLPAMAKELDQSLASIKKLSDDDIAAGKDEWFGQAGALPRGMWVQGGSNMAKFQVAANNLIDRSWLSARAMLKGGGPITDYESNKAENAVSMMKGALDKGDKKSYDDAVIEYEYWIKLGFEKLQQQAGAMPGYGNAAPAPPAAPAAPGGNYIYNPATGKLEPQ